MRRFSRRSEMRSPVTAGVGWWFGHCAGPSAVARRPYRDLAVGARDMDRRTSRQASRCINALIRSGSGSMQISVSDAQPAAGTRSSGVGTTYGGDRSASGHCSAMPGDALGFLLRHAADLSGSVRALCRKSRCGSSGSLTRQRSLWAPAPFQAALGPRRWCRVSSSTTTVQLSRGRPDTNETDGNPGAQ